MFSKLGAPAFRSATKTLCSTTAFRTMRSVPAAEPRPATGSENSVIRVVREVESMPKSRPP